MLWPNAQGRASEPGCAIEAEDSGLGHVSCVLPRSCSAPSPASWRPIFLLPLMSRGGWWGTGRRGSKCAGSREKTEHQPHRCPAAVPDACLAPGPAPPTGGGGERGEASAPGQEHDHCSTNFSPTRPWETDMLGVKRNNHYFFLFYLVNN